MRLCKSPAPVTLQLRPFLAFRNIHELTHENPEANLAGAEIQNGMSYRLYANFPNLNLQVSDGRATYKAGAYWNKNITYSDEYRRGFDCREDLLVPGWFEARLKAGDSLVFSASLMQEDPTEFKRRFNTCVKNAGEITSYRDQLRRCADSLIIDHNGRKRIHAGYSWLYTGMMRETLISLPGLTL